MMRYNEDGRSMIEMLGVLAIIGVLTVGGIAGYTKAMSKYRVNKIKDQISTIVANVRTLYIQQTSYKGLNNKSAIQTDIIPKEMIVENGDGRLIHPFSGQVYVGSGSIGTGISKTENDHKAFLLEYTGLPRSACVDLASSDWGSGSSSGLMGIKVTGYTSPKPTVSTPEFVDDVLDIQFQNNGSSCDGVMVSQGFVIACAGSNKSKLPIPIAQAAMACNCGSTNGCSIVLKYF